MWVVPGRGPRTGNGQPGITSCDTPTDRGPRAVLCQQVLVAGAHPTRTSAATVPYLQVALAATTTRVAVHQPCMAHSLHGLSPELGHSHSDPQSLALQPSRASAKPVLNRSKMTDLKTTYCLLRAYA